MLNFYGSISAPLQRRLAQLTIAKYRTSLLQTLPPRHPNGQSYNWGKKPPKELLDGTIYFGVNGQPKISRLLLETWYQQQRELRQQVATSLRTGSYEVAAVPGTKPVVMSRVKELRQEDILRREEGRFYYPGGQPLSVEATDEEVTLMAAMLGWSVLAVVPETNSALNAAVNAELLAPTTLKPLTSSLLNEFRPMPSDAARHRVLPPPELVESLLDAPELAQEQLPQPPSTAVTLTAEELVDLAAAATELAGQLKAYAHQLEAGELPASLMPQAAALTVLHERYEAALAGIAAAGTLTTALVLPAPPRLPTLDYLRRALEVIEAAQQAVQQADVQQKKALEVLAQVLTLQHKAGPASVLLAEVFAQAHALLTELADLLPTDKHPASAALAEGTHALAQLVSLAAKPYEVSLLEESDPIPQALFATLPGSVVSALLRGRLSLDQEASPPATTSAVEAEPDAQGAAKLSVSVKAPTETTPVAPAAEVPVEAPFQQPKIETEGQVHAADPSTFPGPATRPVLPVEMKAPEIPTEAAGLPLPVINQGEVEADDAVAPPPVVVLPADAPLTTALAAPTAAAALAWLPDTQWDLLEHRRFALAWHLTAAATTHEEEANLAQALPAWTLQCLALAQELGPSDGALQAAFAGALQPELQAEPWSAPNWLHRAVQVAAVLRPALLAPLTQAQELLQGGLPGFADFNKLCQKVFRRTNQAPLQPASLQQHQSEQEWQEQLTKLHEEVSGWSLKARDAEFRQPKNHALNTFWRYCWRRDQLIGKLLLSLEPAATVQVGPVRTLVAALQNEAQLARRLQEADLKLAPNRYAWPWFQMHVAPLLGLAQRWLVLQAQRPVADGLPYQDSQDQTLCRDLAQLLPQARAEVADRRKRETSAAALAALGLLDGALAQLDQLLHGKMPAKAGEPDPGQVLTLPLLRTPDLPLLPDGQPEGEATARLASLRAAAGQPELTWPAAHQAHVRAGNFAACALMRSWEPALAEIGGPADFARSAYQADIRTQESSLTHALRQVELNLETGVRKGYVDEKLRTAGSQLLAKQRAQVSKPQPQELPLSFPYLQRQVAELRRQLEEARLAGLAKVEAKLAELVAKEPEFRRQATAERVARALRESSVSVAHHYAAQLAQDVDITSNALEPTELQTFLSQVPHLEAAAANQTAEEQKTALLRGPSLAGQNLDQVDERTREEASQALADWEQLRAGRTAADAAGSVALGRLLRFIGFPAPELQPVPADATGRPSYEVVDATHMLVKGKEQCPVATFASEAKGEYKLLLTWTRHGEIEDLFERVAAVADRGMQRRPVIVLYFHALSPAQRYNLANLSRERKRTFLVLDKLLLLYLVSAGLQRPRLALFFQLTLPFTHVKPYITGNSTLPPEMFYGREGEKAQLLSSSSDSSCLVYGGRQLGKTAILREIQREYHRPDRDELVLFLDIRRLGGEGHPTKEIVDELAKLLRQTDKFGLPTKGIGNMKITRLLGYVQEWMQGDPTRRLLLFLDEADQFLSQDAAKQFEYTNAFKSLMDDTDRRFKVVFSGTHNVQRIYRLPNQPLSQLGTAVCIGPLIINYEARQAEELVRRPLESLGFEFEKDELVTEILVETNYFPSLIQLFCDRLLTHLYANNPTTLEAGQRPYYLIREHDISSASLKARADIRTKFQLTLDLNLRFKLLAYLLASQPVSEMYGASYQPGLTATQLHEAARDHWPAAFGPHSSDADFEVLLQEVIELSVASVTEDAGEKFYNLRTPNLRQLLGTPADVERELASFFPISVPGAYQADLARDMYGGQGSMIRLPGPLTAAQYAVIRANGTSVVRGTEAAGLNLLEEFLLSQPDVHLEVLGSKFDHDESLCRRELQRIYENRPPFKTTVVLFPRRYSLELVKFAADLTRELTSDIQRLHVTFLMNPAKFLKVLRDKPAPFEQLINLRVSILNLQPWPPQTVAQWLKEVAEVPAYTPRIQELTGGWHVPLFFFLNLQARHAHEDPAQLVAALEDHVRENSAPANWGLEPDTPEEEVLRTVVQYPEPLTQADLEELLPRVPAGSIGLTLNWAEALGLVVPTTQPGKSGTVRAHDYLHRILT